MAFLERQVQVVCSNNEKVEEKVPVDPFENISDYIIHNPDGNTFYIDPGLHPVTPESENPFSDRTFRSTTVYMGPGLHVTDYQLRLNDGALSRSLGQSSDPLCIPQVAPPKRSYRWLIIFATIGWVVTLLCIIVPVVTMRIHKADDNPEAPSHTKTPSTASTAASGTLSSTSFPTVLPTPVTVSNAKGIFNGTSINITPAYDGDNAIHMFFQSLDGEIQYSSRTVHGSWTAVQSLNITDARNNTPLAISSVQNGSTSYMDLFYVDQVNYAQHRHLAYTGSSGTWLQSTTAIYSIEVPDVDTVAFSAINGLAYNASATTTVNTLLGGVGLYVGGVDEQVHEYIYNDTTKAWSIGYVFPNSNGHSGAQITAGHDVNSMHLANNARSLQVWWKYHKGNTTNSTDTSLNTWKSVQISPPIFSKNSSICVAPNETYYQDTEGHIRFYSLDESRPITYNITPPVLQKTSIGCSWSSSTVSIYYQVNGSNIVEGIRNKTEPSGVWTFNTIPIT